QPLAVSHYSVVNCLGTGIREIAAGLRARRSGLAPCDFETVKLDTHIGRVRHLESHALPSDLGAYDCRNNRLAQIGLELDGFAGAVAAARARHGASRIGVFMGTSTSGILETELAFQRRDQRTGALPSGYRYAGTHNTFSLADFVRRYLELTGPALVVSSACSSTAKVFGNAARMIAAGVCDAAVVGGVDTLCLTTLYGFHSLQLTSAGPCRPFDAARDGISIGEGAGFALLERTDDRTGADDLLLLGIGESSDAYHMSTPHPEGLGARLAMQGALGSAGLSPADIDYINLHGTATPSNDASEDLAVRELFGTSTPCSSTKGATGHLLGAAGVTEAIISLLAIEHGLMPGGANTRSVDPALKSHYLLANREARVRRVLSNSFGFGGSNCSLVLGAPG
ncbi:MAG TPA: beta-ketoacyl-[acyl-carrier-protein] synthase family protein, partial [Burkholderiales bacterium]|nr:beta-ketoacyl-[acyl-carrier-protein] synthase family protein [Burkholderiales bacterium]